MAQFAPTYMTVYDTDQSEIAVLAALTLSAAVVDDAAAAGTVIGAINGKSTGGALSLPYEKGRFAISGSNLVVGPDGPIAAGTYPVTILETNQYASTQTKATTINVVSS